MIWDSIILMTIIDLVIISVTFTSLFKLKSQWPMLVSANLIPGSVIMVCGLVIIGTFYAIDLSIMWLMPNIYADFPMMRVMETLHLNFSWIIMLIASICIFVGFEFILKKAFLQTTELKEEMIQRRSSDDLLKYQANHDPLTGLVNRREFERRANQLLDTARFNGMNHALCMMDLDKFKIVNDTCGHLAGDEMLRQLSAMLQKIVRHRDTLARLGGDEFGILMEHCTVNDALRVATSIDNAIRDFVFTWKESKFSVGISIGLVSIDAAVINLTELIQEADIACYMAKKQGGDRIHIYETEDEDTAQQHGERQLVSQINNALAEDKFCLYAQPIQSLSDSKNLSYEILIRMLDESGKVVMPGAFLPAAERYGLMKKVDNWVIKSTLQFLESNQSILNHIGYVSINLSGQSLTDTELLTFITSELQNSTIIGNKLCFEITETAAISNIALAADFIETLRSEGCQIALDDFGSGLSSFAYLKQLPVNYLKIDGLFIRDIVNDPIDHAMVKSINEIGHVMDKGTIAEFVENDETKGMLREIGVDFIQGYGVGKPVPIMDILINYNKALEN